MFQEFIINEILHLDNLSKYKRNNNFTLLPIRYQIGSCGPSWIEHIQIKTGLGWVLFSLNFRFYKFQNRPKIMEQLEYRILRYI